MEELIRKVIGILDTVEVKGKANMNKVLVSMQALEKVADAMKHNRETMAKVAAAGYETKEGVEKDEH